MRNLYKIFLSILFLLLLHGNAISSNYFWEKFDVNPSSAWVTDRYAPKIFESLTFDGDKRLHIQISKDDDLSRRPSPYQSTFYNTQGMQLQIGNSNPSMLQGDLYISSDWETNHRRSDLWAVTTDGSSVTDYPIIGFANTNGSNPSFRIWDNNLGDWSNVAYTIVYDKWYRFTIVFTDTYYKFYINGDLVYTETTVYGSTTLQALIVQGYNFGDPGIALPATPSFDNTYDIYWDNIATASNEVWVDNSWTSNLYGDPVGGGKIFGINAFANIQDGINNVLSGGKVNVAAGTYNESPNINKSLSLLGAGRDVTNIALQSANSGSLVVGSANVTVSGFAIIGYDGDDSRDASNNVYITLDAENVTISNNKLLVGKMSGSDNGDQGIGLLTVSNESETPISNLTVTGNIFQPVTTESQRAFYINPGVDNFSFQNNTISGNFTGRALTQAQHGLVENNILTGEGVAGSRSGGFGTWGEPTPSIYGRTNFRNNQITGTNIAIKIYETDNVSIEGNVFNQNGEGVWIGDANALPFDASTISIHQNSFTASDGFDIENTKTSPVNASCNWFGSSDFATIAAKVSGPVNFIPWLTSGGNSASIGFTPTGACEMPPIAYYKLDKCTGDQAPDEISPKADGSLHYNGIYPQWVAGHKNQCLRFIGDDNYVNLGTPDKLNFKANNSFTISVWVKPFAWNSVGNSDQQIFTKGNGPALSDGANSTQYELKKMTRPDNHADVVVLRAWHNGNAVGTIEAPISNLPLNSWTHIVAEYECTNPAAGTGTYRLYFNGGNKVESNNNQSGPVVTNERCIIGAVSVGSGVVQDWWNGLIDEVKVYNLALNDADVAALYNSANIDHGWACDDVNPPMDENLKLALRLDPYHITDATPTPANGTAVSFWKDLATSPQEEDATMSDPKMQPKFVENGVNGAGVQFSYDYGKTAYGNSKILRSDAADEIMTTNTDMWVPAAQSKTVFVVFKTGSITDAAPYYSDGRQCIFEAGGPLSGYNLYIKNGKIIFGMWNALQQEYQILDEIPSIHNFYPLNSDKIYLAQIEYNGATKKFRVVFSNEVGTAYSDCISFSGLSRDLNYMNDNTGIGGASRTMYDDYSTGETYSDNFGGIMGDVLVYNSFLDDATNKLVYKYINDRLGTDFIYPDAAGTLPKIGNQWITVEKTTPIDGFVSSAYPNPFVSKTFFSINLPEKQIVTVELIDAMGNTIQNVFAGELGNGIHDVTIDGSGLVTGMYVYKVTGTNFVQSGKVVLMK